MNALQKVLATHGVRPTVVREAMIAVRRFDRLHGYVMECAGRAMVTSFAQAGMPNLFWLEAHFREMLLRVLGSTSGNWCTTMPYMPLTKTTAKMRRIGWTVEWEIQTSAAEAGVRLGPEKDVRYCGHARCRAVPRPEQALAFGDLLEEAGHEDAVRFRRLVDTYCRLGWNTGKIPLTYRPDGYMTP